MLTRVHGLALLRSLRDALVSVRHIATRGYGVYSFFEFPGTFSPALTSYCDNIVDQDTDQHLIERCLAGQTATFGMLVERYQSRLIRSLTHALGNRDDALDVAQEAFLRAYQKLASFRGESAFYSWLYRVALNIAATRHRRPRVPVTSLNALQDEHGIEAASHGGEELHAETERREERKQLLLAALASLAEEFRIVLVLRELDGLAYEEIARLTDCPVGTVRSRIFRARAELRRKLWPRLKAEFA